MAKLRKQRQGDQRSFPDSITHPSLAIVRHQKLCLRVDISEQRLFGYTELKVVAPTSGVIGLHAHGLNIEKVLFEGVPVHFDIAPCPENPSNLSSELESPDFAALDAAKIAYTKYLLLLKNEAAPELLIHVPSESTLPDGVNESLSLPSAGAMADKGISDEEQPAGGGSQEAAKTDAPSQLEEKLKLVRVDYWLEKPVTGAHFLRRVFLTNNQLRRARCWFPCVDFDLHRCTFDMEFTVNSDYVAVSSGKLLYQVFSKADPSLKTYVYKLDIPVATEFISLVVAPLDVLPDRQFPAISHLCMQGSLLKLQCTVSFFHFVFSFYEDYLGVSFPFGSYNHVFIDSELTITSISICASMAILSSHLLVDERIIDQTANTRIKIAHALAQQWFGVYIMPDTWNDAWLVEGLAGFLTDAFIKRHFGNNEAFYRRYKANESVCKADVEGAPSLSPAVGMGYIHKTERISVLGKIRSWKAVAVIEMLEKQMGPEPFRKILQRIMLRAQDPLRNLRTLSTKEFRHFANKIGNLERPFLKDFFLRWVESTGCPVLRMAFAYIKRKNMIELAVHRGCTAVPGTCSEENVNVSEGKQRDTDIGWPGMMSIRVHEVDGTYDHPILPMAGDIDQLLEIQCHSKLGGRRIQRPKKGSKPEATEDLDPTPAFDMQQGIDSPLLWLRADPQMEYLAEIQFHQPEYMWINQLEKDRDVIAQIQAVSALATLPQISFTTINALNSCLNDLKVFCRVRVEAAIALTDTASEATGWVGLSHLIKFYKSRCYDAHTGLPRSNDFNDLAEYFVLQVIPGAVATIRGNDGKSPAEAVDFIMQLLKHNDNNGNLYSDAYWLASLIQAIGRLEFSEHSVQALARILKHIDRFLQYDRLMTSYNSLVTLSCIRTLTELALKFSHLLPMDQFEQLLHPFRDSKTTWWKVRALALESIFDLKVYVKGLDEGIQLALELVDADPAMRVQCRLFAHVLHVCSLKVHSSERVSKESLIGLLNLLEHRNAFNNTFLRHHVFCLLQTLAGRPATLLQAADIPPVRDVETPSMQSLTKVAPIENATPDDSRGKNGPVRVRIQCPQEPQIDPLLTENLTPGDSKGKIGPLKVRILHPQESQTEPVRIRLVPPGSQTLREVPATSNSSGKPEVEKKVGVLKLRLKPTSSTQEALTEDERGPISGPVHSSSVSVEFSLKADHTIDESPNSNRATGLTRNIAEGNDLSERTIQKQGCATCISSDKASLKCNLFELKDVESQDVIEPERMRSLEALVNRLESDAGMSFCDRLYTGESHDSSQLRLAVEEERETRSKTRVEDEDSSMFSFDDGEKKEAESARTQDKREKKRRKDDRDRHEKKREKYNDPLYLEKKRLKKEERRKEKEQHRLQKSNENAITETVSYQTSGENRTVAGSSDTVVRIKFKNLL